ncbi:MAG: hypothetical protein ACFB0E_15925 [Leptolyngbyaceae cyanobacterium]
MIVLQGAIATLHFSGDVRAPLLKRSRPFVVMAFQPWGACKPIARTRLYNCLYNRALASLLVKLGVLDTGIVSVTGGERTEFSQRAN